MLNQPFKPMILKPTNDIPKGPYIHSLKWDGHRALLHYDRGQVRIYTRHGNLCTQYPELHTIQLPVESCILDGEIIVLDSSSTVPKPCFDSLMTRFQASREVTIRSFMKDLPVVMVAWDIIYLNEQSLVHHKIEDRLSILKEKVIPSNVLTLTPTYEDGEALFQNVKDLGLEGIVSKRLGTRYLVDAPPAKTWLKKKAYLTLSNVTIHSIRKKKFGWGLQANNRYVGVSEFAPLALRKMFYPAAKKQISHEDSNWIYLNPGIPCEVKFQCYTKNGLLRSPSITDLII